MATFKLTRFSTPEALKAIRKNNLLALLRRHYEFFKDRGLTVPGEGDGGLDYEKLVEILMTPDERTPAEFVEDLFYVHEMATQAGMDGLLEDLAREGADDLDVGQDPTPADVAVLVRVHRPELLERRHAEQLITNRRSFDCYKAETEKPTPEGRPSAAALRGMEQRLDAVFEEMKRGRGVKVHMFPDTTAFIFLVRHGDPCKREGAIQDGLPGSVYYRPERHDILKFDLDLRELSMNVPSKRIGDLYLEEFGLLLFGDRQVFEQGVKYTLEPLRTDGERSLVCSDTEGLEWVRLKEIQYFWGGLHGEVEVRKASDVFAALRDRERSIPPNVRIMGARFQFKVAGSKTPRMVAIRPPTVASYTRDSDAEILEQWLRRRGFANSEHKGDA